MGGICSTHGVKAVRVQILARVSESVYRLDGTRQRWEGTKIDLTEVRPSVRVYEHRTEVGNSGVF